jgi:hypothetical protein
MGSPNNSKDKLLFMSSALILILVAAITYKSSNGDISQTSRAAFAVSILMSIALKWRSAKARGLSTDQFYLEEAGSPEKLILKAKWSQILGYICLIIPAMAFIYGLCVSTILDAFTYFVFFCLSSVPFGALLLWSAANSIRIASKEKGTHNSER